jgi:hypothetical protein
MGRGTSICSEEFQGSERRILSKERATTAEGDPETDGRGVGVRRWVAQPERLTTLKIGLSERP